MERLTAKDYKSKRSNLEAKIKHLENQAKERLLFLAEKFPNAIVSNIGGTNIFAKGIVKSFVKDLEWELVITYIEAIENFIAEKYEQGELF